MKKTTIFLLLTTLLFNLTGCYDAMGIEELSYVVAIGLDTTDDNQLELTLQFATSGESSSDESSQSSSQSKETNITTIKCSSINSGISLINNHISKKVNLSHCQVILISEELAKNGVEEYIDTLFNNIEIRKDCSIIVTKCPAKEYLKNVKPALENLTARYYESTLNSAEYTGYTADITLSQFYSKMNDSYCESYAILGSITSDENSSKPSKINADYTSGESPITDKDVIDNLGIAVFKGDKFVGELTGLDSVCHVITNNELDECILSVPNPFKEGKYIDLALNQEKRTKCTISFEGTAPQINLDIYLNGCGVSIDGYTDYNSKESLNALKHSAETYISEIISSYLYKTSQTYNSDICGFGKYAVSRYMTLDDWYNSNWLENYKNSKFNVNVHVTVKTGAVFTE